MAETSKFPVESLKEGMILMQGLLYQGGIILEAGTEIAPRHLKQLAAWGIKEIEVEGIYPSLDRVVRMPGEAEEIEVVDIEGLQPSVPGVETAAPPAHPLPPGYSSEDGKLYIIEEDLSGFDEGVVFPGGLLFQGNISGPLDVKAGGEIQVMGDMEGDINLSSAHGDIIVKGKAVGGEEKIRLSGGELTVRTAEKCVLRARGSVRSERLISSSVKASGEVLVTGGEGRIEGGDVESGSRVRAKIMGNLKYEETRISVSNLAQKQAFANAAKLERAVEEKRGEMGKLEKVIEVVKLLGDKVVSLPPEKKADLAAKSKRYMELRSEIKALLDAMERTKMIMQGEIKSRDECPIVTDRIYPGVSLNLGTSTLVVNAKAELVGYYLKGGRILAMVEKR